MKYISYEDFISLSKNKIIQIYLFDGTKLNILFDEAYINNLPCIYQVKVKNSFMSNIYVGYNENDQYKLYYLYCGFFNVNPSIDTNIDITEKCQKIIDYYRLLEKV